MSDAARLRAWLAFISVRTRGMAADFSRQALYSEWWPPTRPDERHNPMSNEPSLDVEANALETACNLVEQLTNVLDLATETRRRRGGDTFGIDETTDLLRHMRAGFERARDRRRRELVPAGAKR